MCDRVCVTVCVFVCVCVCLGRGGGFISRLGIPQGPKSEGSKQIKSRGTDARGAQLIPPPFPLSLQVPELGQLSQQLANKYGKEFAASAAGDETARFVQVNEKLMECLSVYPPVGQAKLDLLAEVPPV